ncbi:flagellar assembly protein FliW [Paenibacillus sp. MWE-103]|uniref:Flagellar assembly factor FliW n=1 Tax=Paenibacillus artemisiicola TaxID=1172618 RepID=A0ABS3WFX8_9BACL|nr:flagellar assembly protein FliW [Paenibacillus artemisiicola]MBO7747231.1 flagellar assembly protein FliW [Paenibacillus artemisiicola]
MILQTTRFGQIEIEDHQWIVFPSGIPGFPQHKRYTLVSIEDSPFYVLQSVEEGSLSFIVTSPFDFFPDYEFELESNMLHELGQPSPEQVRVLNIVTVKDKLEEATANLAAPIVWNTANRQAAQVILQHTSYRTKHALFSPPSGNKGEASC